jgi:hypothetical protein
MPERLHDQAKAQSFSLSDIVACLTEQRHNCRGPDRIQDISRDPADSDAVMKIHIVGEGAIGQDNAFSALMDLLILRRSGKRFVRLLRFFE